MANEYIGEVYLNKMTLSGANPAKFETRSLGLADSIVLVKTNAVYMGRQGSQTYPVGVDETVSLRLLDVADLWFKNQDANNEGVVHIIGTLLKGRWNPK